MQAQHDARADEAPDDEREQLTVEGARRSASLRCIRRAHGTRFPFPDEPARRAHVLIFDRDPDEAAERQLSRAALQMLALNVRL